MKGKKGEERKEGNGRERAWGQGVNTRETAGRDRGREEKTCTRWSKWAYGVCVHAYTNASRYVCVCVTVWVLHVCACVCVFVCVYVIVWESERASVNWVVQIRMHRLGTQAFFMIYEIIGLEVICACAYICIDGFVDSSCSNGRGNVFCLFNVYIYIYIHIYIHTYVYKFVHAFQYIWANSLTCVYIRMHPINLSIYYVLLTTDSRAVCCNKRYISYLWVNKFKFILYIYLYTIWFLVLTIVPLATIGATIRRDIAAYARITSDVVFGRI